MSPDLKVATAFVIAGLTSMGMPGFSGFHGDFDGFAVAQYDAIGMIAAAAASGATTPQAMTEYLASKSYSGLAMTYKSDGKGNMAHSSMMVCYDGISRLPKIAKRYD